MTTTNDTPAAPDDLKGAWLDSNDLGPHRVVVPTMVGTGRGVMLLIANEGVLIRSGRLPADLTEAALIGIGNEDGIEGYMADLALIAAHSDNAEARQRLASTMRHAVDLKDWLLAECLVDPKLTPEEVAALPEQDRELLLAIIERKRNTDAEGNVLPIALVSDFARFRRFGTGADADGARDRDGADVPAPHTRPDEHPQV